VVLFSQGLNKYNLSGALAPYYAIVFYNSCIVTIYLSVAPVATAGYWSRTTTIITTLGINHALCVCFALWFLVYSCCYRLNATIDGIRTLYGLCLGFKRCSTDLAVLLFHASGTDSLKVVVSN